MKILLTGSSGRVGRAIYIRLCADHKIVGYDKSPSSTTDVVASLSDATALRSAVDGCEAVIHSAALHAPHVGIVDEGSFELVNVACTATLAQLCLEAGVKQFVYTSTTALYGKASTPEGRAGWVTEETVPDPNTIYHRTKLRAEALLEVAAGSGALAVVVIRMSRCFPELAPIMSSYRLHRGVDSRDVADAHACALSKVHSGFHKYIVSGATPFLPSDTTELLRDAAEVIRRRVPTVAAAFAHRGWDLPKSIDRVYSCAKANVELGWRPFYGPEEVMAELDRKSSEILPLRHN